MSNENTKPTATRVGTLELAMELKDLSAVLAGLEQIKVAAHDAAAAVASIGSGRKALVSAVIIDAAYAAAFAEQWVKDVRRGSDICGMVPRTVTEFISELSKLAVAQ